MSTRLNINLKELAKVAKDISSHAEQEGTSIYTRCWDTARVVPGDITPAQRADFANHLFSVVCTLNGLSGEDRTRDLALTKQLRSLHRRKAS